VTNPVTPSPDPWEVLTEAVIRLHLVAHLESQDADDDRDAALAALTTLRTQAERREAMLRRFIGAYGKRGPEGVLWSSLVDDAHKLLTHTEEPTKDER
jgi:hypothetical protein